jgi:lysylphosphatidylglycerol synthetase-like protein (DUF2156 family)
MSSQTPAHRLRVLREHGNFALAYSATFQPGLEYFGDAEGFLAYKQVGSTAFVLSNPVAPTRGYEHLIRSFMKGRSDICFWQASRPVAKILEKIGLRVYEMGTETRIALGDYDFAGPRKRNFRRALNRAACCSYTIVERSVTSLNREELQTVSDRWRQTRGVKDREMTFLTRPAVLDNEVDVRKFFTFDHEGRLLAFAFFDPIYNRGQVVGYLCSAKRRLPQTPWSAMRFFIRRFGLFKLREEKCFPWDSRRCAGLKIRNCAAIAWFAGQRSRLIALLAKASPCRISSKCLERAIWRDLRRT